MKKRYLALTLCLLSGSSFAESFFADVQPTRYSATVGLNFRPKQLYSQEFYLQESLFLRGGLHWPSILLEQDLVVSAGFEKFQSLPRNSKQVGIDIVESRVGLEAGLENHLILPVGTSVGVTRISKTSKLNVGEYVIDDSATKDFSESIVVPSLRFWIGVPLIPEKLQLSAGVQRVFMSRPADERLNYSSEFRIEF